MLLGGDGVVRYRRRARAGFTIVEVLISVVVISLALVGILALLTASTKVAGEVVEDSYAATLARSVFEALREGARTRSFAVQDGPNLVYGFEFLHQGVLNDGFAPPSLANGTPPPLPTSTSDTAGLNNMRKSDFAIFLPPKSAGSGATGGGTNDPYFVFPRPANTSMSEVATQNANNTDNFLAPGSAGSVGHSGPLYYDVKRVYSLKNRLSAATTTTGVVAGPAEQQDQYGFAVVVRRSKAPPLKSDSVPTQSDGLQPADGLYEVTVLIYRNFDPQPTSRTHEALPGGRYTELMAIGY